MPNIEVTQRIIIVVFVYSDAVHGWRLWVESRPRKSEGVILPVYLEWVEQPSEQDWIDLEKLYKETPAQWFDELNVDSVQGYVALHQGSQPSKLAAGRFNDRLLTTARLNAVEAGYEISQLCVRSVTRQRGVAHQMMIRLTQWADEQACSLMVQDSASELSTLITKLKDYGFSLDGDTWKRPPQGV